MFIYLLNYSVYNSALREYNVNIHDVGWDYIESKLRNVYENGGEFVIEKSIPFYNEGKYVEFKKITGYSPVDRYSFISDKRHGYLLTFYIEENQGDIESGHFDLLNKNCQFSTKKITFEPYDDEWLEKYVNQDFDLALTTFKEIYENGMLSSDTIYRNFSRDE